MSAHMSPQQRPPSIPAANDPNQTSCMLGTSPRKGHKGATGTFREGRTRPVRRYDLFFDADASC
jgi:hypothetical protein